MFPDAAGNWNNVRWNDQIAIGTQIIQKLEIYKKKKNFADEDQKKKKRHYCGRFSLHGTNVCVHQGIEMQSIDRYISATVI